MIDALLATPRSLLDRQLLRIMFVVALWSAALYVIVLLVLVLALDGSGFFDLFWAPSWIPEWFGPIGLIVASIVLFFGIFSLTMVLVVQNTAMFFLDRVIAVVEQKEYPELGPARETTIRQDIDAAIRFSIFTVILNLLALPVYVIGSVIPFVTFLALYGINGYLFGREYSETVLRRRHAATEVGAWRRTNRFPIFFAGVLIAVAMFVPVLNLATPVVAAVLMTHVCHRYESNGSFTARTVHGSTT